MTERRRAPRFGAYAYTRVLGVIALGLLPALAAFAGAAISMWLVWGSFVVGSVAAGVLASWLMRRFRCPRCGRSIVRHEPTAGAEGAPILYVCRACDIAWDSGLRTPSIR